MLSYLLDCEDAAWMGHSMDERNLLGWLDCPAY